MKHTPTPWRTVAGYGGINVIGANEYGVALVHQLVGLNAPQTEANAEFIVRAVNCHDELLAACKAALGSFEKYETQFTSHPLFGELRAAIAKAEGGTV